jgi:hypothetical protein
MRKITINKISVLAFSSHCFNKFHCLAGFVLCNEEIGWSFLGMGIRIMKLENSPMQCRAVINASLAASNSK